MKDYTTYVVKTPNGDFEQDVMNIGDNWSCDCAYYKQHFGYNECVHIKYAKINKFIKSKEVKNI